MSTIQRARLDAQLRDAGAVVGADSEPSVDEIRESFAKLMSSMPVPEGVRVDETVLGGRPALRVSPDTTAGPAAPAILLYLHGGSHVVGSPRTALGLTAGLVIRTGLPSISLDYRLAPEHPFPADVQDVVAAYRDLLDQGYAPESVAFAGDSAGGGLTISGALAARDAGLPAPAAIVAFSPGLDATRTGRSMTTKADADPLLDRAALDRLSSLYVVGQDRRDPLLSPAVTADLTGLPPLLVQVSTNEMLLDDARRLAQRAADAEVDVILDITAQVPHVFQSFTHVLDEAGEALDRAALFLRQHVRT
ncbi:alpha/beta hydrolase [Actinacidiphila guanduensis]|uniref:Acetyl esterase/lipase n=1 Tax=Actinacidiphila guanduensis TaxID=310781 RepID=A0A1H0IUN8_9ACTN|nr:alpha/beta hydrolase [Actinacidiphila guanduensis]SDO35216.1 Acetyl esterase/lipase [Actinacidiphila guanduensis]